MAGCNGNYVTLGATELAYLGGSAGKLPSLKEESKRCVLDKLAAKFPRATWEFRPSSEKGVLGSFMNSAGMREQDVGSTPIYTLHTYGAFRVYILNRVVTKADENEFVQLIKDCAKGAPATAGRRRKTRSAKKTRKTRRTARK